MNVKNLCRKENIAHQGKYHNGFRLSSLQYLPLFFSFWIHLWWCEMLTSSDLRQSTLRLPEFCFLELSPSVVNQSLCTQQSDLSPIWQGRLPPGVGATVSPQGAATWRGVVCISRMSVVVWVTTQHQDPGDCSHFSPQASIPSLFSSNSIPLCPSLCQRFTPVVVSFSCQSSPSALSSQA